jgi:hypothetical protein
MSEQVVIGPVVTDAGRIYVGAIEAGTARTSFG